MSLIDKFCRTDFTSYEDFYENFKINVPDNFNFGYDVVDAVAEENPERKALIWCDDTEEHDRTFTFKDISRLSNKTANYLVSKGIKKGDKIMLILKRNYQFWYVITALHKIGAIAIPATFLLTKKDIVYRNNIAGVKAIISANSEEIHKHVDDAVPDSPTLEYRFFVNSSGESREGWIDLDSEIEKFSDEFPRPTGEKATKNEDIMLIYFTSGTTGNPKMVAHNFKYPLGHIITAKFWHDLHPGSIHISVADTGWAKCAWGKIYGQWICEATMFVYDMEKFVPKLLIEKISKHKVTSFCAPPTIYRFMMRENMADYDLSSLEHACIAGEPLNPEIFNNFKELTGLNMMEGFGQSETVVALANFKWMTPKPGSMGKPSPVIGTMLVDENGYPVGPGEEGEIVFKADLKNPPPGLFTGYLEDEEKTRSCWHDGFYHTGDIAWMDEDGYVFYVGRDDDVIKSSGYRIGPFEVESALVEHPAVLETAITAVPDPIRGQIVKATVVLTNNYEPSDELIKELQDHVKQLTAPYKYPRVIEFVDELPKTYSGKIKRAQIRNNDK